MSFGPFLKGEESVFSYEKSKQDALESGLVLEGSKNFYDRVLDFNWHK